MAGHAGAGALVRVNGQDFTAGPIEAGAVIQVGSTFFEIHAR